MTAFTEKLDRAAGAALCEGLTVAGQSLIGAGAVSLAFGGAGVVPISLGAAALMTSAAGCNWDPDAPGPPTPITGGIGGCIEVQNGDSQVLIVGPQGTRNPEDRIDMQQLTGATYQGMDANGFQLFQVRGFSNSIPVSIDNVRVNASDVPGYFTLFTSASNPCGKSQDPPVPPGPDIDPYTYTDPEDGCTLIVNWKGFSTDESGHVSPVYKIEAGADTLRSGGVIGGCNFEPVIYTGPPGGPPGPPLYGPWDPIWDDPLGPLSPWGDFLRDLAGGLLGNIIYDTYKTLVEEPYAGTTYRLVSVCETDASGEPISEAVEEVIPQAKFNDAVLFRLDALTTLLQAQKDFKQPVCPPARLEGDFRTISFRSEEVSPNGKSCLRKRLRYRSVSGIGLDGLIDHWKDFSYTAGPVVVKHRGSSWGTITVWASSIDEGKRVILHAAGEAGIDANQTGRWEISGSSSPRLGMPGTMNVDTTGGYYWITARDDSDNRPIVGKT